MRRARHCANLVRRGHASMPPINGDVCMPAKWKTSDIPKDIESSYQQKRRLLCRGRVAVLPSRSLSESLQQLKVA